MNLASRIATVERIVGGYCAEDDWCICQPQSIALNVIYPEQPNRETGLCERCWRKRWPVFKKEFIVMLKTESKPSTVEECLIRLDWNWPESKAITHWLPR